MRPTVLLFDIDGTLITTGTAARDAIVRAFFEAFGVPDAFDFPFDGMTDRAIVRRALERAGLPASDETIDHFLERYVEVLEEEMARAPIFRLHNGMERAVYESLERPNIAVGLGTGNVRAGARIKLERVNFFEPFAFGGFGCDHEERPELIRIGAARGAAKLGLPLEACRVVVIGDTPKDIAAARAIGAESIGVGTGHFGPAQLLACGATWAFRDFSEPEALAALLGR